MTDEETAERIRELSIIIKQASDELATLVGRIHYMAEDSTQAYGAVSR